MQQEFKGNRQKQNTLWGARERERGREGGFWAKEIFFGRKQEWRGKIDSCVALFWLDIWLSSLFVCCFDICLFLFVFVWLNLSKWSSRPFVCFGVGLKSACWPFEYLSRLLFWVAPCICRHHCVLCANTRLIHCSCRFVTNINRLSIMIIAKGYASKATKPSTSPPLEVNFVCLLLSNNFLASQLFFWPKDYI